MSIREEIILQLKSVLQGVLGVEIEPQLSFPSEMQFGDYSTNVAMVGYQKIKNQKSKIKSDEFNSPMELAEEIKKELGIRNQELGILRNIEVVKPGFINFWLSDKILLQQLENGVSLQEGSVIVNSGKGKKVVVEYSSPNIAKPFTIGHLRSTIIGDAVANLLQATGWTVYRDNHVGDWGTQFGKQIAALKFISLKDGHIDMSDHGVILKENIDLIEQSERPVKLLVDLYVKFHQVAEEKYEENGERKPNGVILEEFARKEFLELEKGNPRTIELWKKCIDWSWKEFEKIYQELGVPSWKDKDGKKEIFENEGRGYGESFFENKMAFVIHELKETKIDGKPLLQEGDDGAQLVFFPDEKYPPLMILKKDGATLYATRDLATDRFRLDTYGKDVVIINEIGAEQSLYMNQIYLTEALLGWVKKGQRIHIKHGLYRFKEGKMSTRKGNVIWLEDVLAEAVNRAYFLRKDVVSEDGRGEDNIREHAIEMKKYLPQLRAVGVGAIKWNDLKRDSIQDIAFDWDDALNMDGNSGPYMQYAYARTRSILSKMPDFSVQISDITMKGLIVEESDLLRWMARFDAVVVEAAERYAPNILCNYLFVLAQLFNLFYQKCPILKAEESVRNFRLGLVSGVSVRIKRGLEILGIETPERM